MHFSTTAIVLSTLAAGQALAASILPHAHGHAHQQGKRHNNAVRHVEFMKAQSERRDAALLSATDSSLLTTLGFTSSGTNAVASSATVPWLGNDGKWTNEFTNESDDDIVLAVWGPVGSWVNNVKPQITVSIPKGGSKTVSFPDGWSGAWAPVHKGTKLVMGQIYDTWGEATFSAPFSVADVSREVNMKGRSMTIVTPTCTSDMNTCVFKCDGGVETCMTGYSLVNCATNSQPGAYFGYDYLGAASGGCGGMGNSANLKTILGN
ncbi:hypothetical protein LTR64_007988 [Lithohypha guttulata]|uniref:Uncharacterized protein n=1 Tax=Lithohypha guttulata TaxID=1690604 RepID=A0AAN7SZD4_9EURO|nr:hypothetical protein LTR51_008143 [Lithohypha guttulata]KAK5084691.1 hypothetical protein LTR05_005769 [Lithohypha guttulata]